MVDIFFEGDGILGIEWKNEDGRLTVKNIMSGTVANEYYDLKVGFSVKEINGEEYDDLSYIKKIAKIMDIWHKDSEIRIIFEEIKIDKNIEIYNFLEENGFKEYYDKFIELGANKVEDFDFIELTDLYSMGLTLDKGMRLYKLLKKKCTSEVFEEL